VNNVHDSLLIATPPEQAYALACFVMSLLERMLTVPVVSAPGEPKHTVQVQVYAAMMVGSSWSKKDATEFKRLPAREVFERAVETALARRQERVEAC